MKTQITGHFILYEVLQVSTGRILGELAIARDEPEHEKTLKKELRNLAKESGVRFADIQYKAQGQ